MMNILDELPCGILITDSTGCVLSVNAGIAEMLGEVGDSLVGRSIEDLLPPASRIFLQTHVWPTLFRDGLLNEIHLQVMGAKRSRLPVLLNAKLGKFADSAAFYWTLFIVKERHSFEAALVAQRNAVEASNRALEQAQLFIKKITDAIPSMIAYWDKDLRCHFANQAYGTWFGRDPVQMIGVTLPELLGDELFKKNEGYVRDVLAGTDQRFERTLTKADGSIGYTLAHYLSDERQGEIQGFFVLVNDVTHLKESQLALEEAQRLGQIGSWHWQIGSNVVTWSPQLFTIFGLDPEGPAPSFSEQKSLYVEDDFELLRTKNQVTLASGAPYKLELRYSRSDGSEGWVEARGEVVRATTGQVVGLRGTLLEISLRKKQQESLQHAKSRLQAMYETTPAMLHSIDEQGRIIHVSNAWLERLGYSREEVLGCLSSDFLSEESRRRARQEILPAFFVSGRCDDVPYEMVAKNGEIVDVVLSAILERDSQGKPIRSLAVVQDVTLRRRAECQLLEQHELMRVTLNSIGDAVITADANGLVSWLNPVAERMTGWLASDAVGLPLPQVFHIVNEETRERAPDPVAACLAEGRIVGLAHQTLLISKDNAEYGIQDSAAPIRNAEGTVLGVVLVFHDVSEQRRLSGEMTYRATHDALTGLVNRAEFEARLQTTLRHTQENDSHHALMYIDLDQFKLVNDACGHAIGDQLLQQVSKLLADAVRSRDTLARLGGDEFAIILENCEMEQAAKVAQKICDRMEVFRFVHDDRRFRIGTSIGLVPVDKRWYSTAAIQQAADTSCYAAKEAGRNRVHAWCDADGAMRSRSNEVQWTSRIEKALDNDGFVLHAQRIEALSKPTRFIRVEVLLRMLNDDGTLVQPASFLPAAERFNLVSRIDRWVLGRAIAWMQCLPELNQIESLSLNISGRSLGDRTFHAWVYELLERAGSIVCERLCFEITEMAAVTNLADAAVFIDKVRALGCKVSLDDFGAGASSFGYLKTLSVDYLKIDGQYIQNLLSSSLDEAAVRCFVDVAKLMSIKTVAEFVDSEEVLNRLKEMNVNYAQGFLLHCPEPLAELVKAKAVFEV